MVELEFTPRQLLLCFLKKDMGWFYQCDSVYVSLPVHKFKNTIYLVILFAGYVLDCMCPYFQINMYMEKTRIICLKILCKN